MSKVSLQFLSNVREEAYKPEREREGIPSKNLLNMLAKVNS